LAGTCLSSVLDRRPRGDTPIQRGLGYTVTGRSSVFRLRIVMIRELTDLPGRWTLGRGRQHWLLPLRNWGPFGGLFCWLFLEGSATFWGSPAAPGRARDALDICASAGRECISSARFRDRLARCWECPRSIERQYSSASVKSKVSWGRRPTETEPKVLRAEGLTSELAAWVTWIYLHPSIHCENYTALLGCAAIGRGYASGLKTPRRVGNPLGVRVAVFRESRLIGGVGMCRANPQKAAMKPHLLKLDLRFRVLTC